MKNICLILLIAFNVNMLNAQQKKITGTSPSKQVNLKPTYTRGLPPNLYADLSFKDQSGNGSLEAQETSTLKIKLTNKGKGPAYGLQVQLEDSVNDQSLSVQSLRGIEKLEPNESIDLSINIAANIDVKSLLHKIKINVLERFGYDMDPAFLYLHTRQYQKPELIVAGFDIIDSGDGTAAIQEDGQLQAGEYVKAKIIVQNIGQGTAEKAKCSIYSKDPNILINLMADSIGTLKPGQIKELWVDISPNKRINTPINESLPIYITIQEKIGMANLVDYQLPIQIGKRPPKTKILEVAVKEQEVSKDIVKFEFTSNKFSTAQAIVNISSPTPSFSKRPNAIAFSLGVEKYSYITPAPYAANDAAIISANFKNRLGIDNVTLLTDDQVTSSKLKTIFNPEWGRLKNYVDTTTDIFVYFSGHGIPDKEGKNVYLFPSDGLKEGVNELGYNIQDLYNNLNSLNAKSYTIVLDACFSGSNRPSTKISQENLIAQKGIKIEPKTPWLDNPKFTVITSSAQDETSLGYDASESGLFTYFFCAGLQGKADLDSDHKITLGELRNYVTENVVKTSKQLSGLQTPQFYGDDQKVMVEY